MYILSNNFCINQTEAPKNLPMVKTAEKFFKQINNFDFITVKDPMKSGAKRKEI